MESSLSRRHEAADTIFIGAAPGKGEGVYAMGAFAVGDLVVEGRPVRSSPHRTRYTVQKDWDLHLELDETARSLNHSCTPNTGVVDNAHGGYDFVAVTPIRPGDEITFDYESTEYESIGVVDCLCLSPDCRGRTRGFRYRSDPMPYAAAYLREHAPRV